MLDRFEVESWFSGEMDGNDAIVSINPGQGGLEAQDWTEMLYRMYMRYAEQKGWKAKPLDVVPGEGIGLDRAVIQTRGATPTACCEASTACIVWCAFRRPTTRNAVRTTFAGVEVLPVMSDDIEVNLNPADVRVDVYRSSGPGGQCVNTTDSAVRFAHIPTGIVVTCQNEKSQLQNKEAAFKVLRAKLYELEQRKRDEEVAALRGERMENSFGSQIRNYVLYPYQLVKDLRSNMKRATSMRCSTAISKHSSSATTAGVSPSNKGMIVAPSEGNDVNLQELERQGRRILRIDIVNMVAEAGSGHPGGSLSSAEILCALYFGGVLERDPSDPAKADRDRFVLSKGHAAPVLYAALAEAGYFPKESCKRCASCTAVCRGTPTAASFPASRRPPALWARACPSRRASHAG